jgi:hypothetical protein
MPDTKNNFQVNLKIYDQEISLALFCVNQRCKTLYQFPQKKTFHCAKDLFSASNDRFSFFAIA